MFARASNVRAFASSPRSLTVVGLFLGASVYSLFSAKPAKAHDKQVALDPKTFKPFALTDVYQINHNTKRFRFALEPDQTIGLTVASCLVVKAPIGENGKDVIRPYTPVSGPSDVGFFDLVVKIYPEGVMSKHFESLEPGQTLDVKGPFPKLAYKPNLKKRIGMVAGGSGITPMLQVVDEILRNSDDKTEVDLVFANQTEEDVLLRNEIDLLQLRHKNFKVHYTITNKTTKSWKYDVGHLDEEKLKNYLPPPSDDNLVLVCGPPGMMKLISGEKNKDMSQGELTGLLKKLGYNEKQVYKF